MTTVNRNQKQYPYLMPTLVPIQIWPKLARIEKIKVKKGLRANKSFQKYYQFIIILIMIGVIASNGYIAINKFAQWSSIPKAVPSVSFDKLFQPLISVNVFNGLPTRLKIPSIGIDASVQQVGQTSEGLMGVPSNTADVGWYKFGPVPGQKGSAVIGAHFDEPDGSPAVFSQLHKLKEGDSIIVENDKNAQIRFLVKRIANYDADSYASEVFDENDGIHLNLITCNGFWDTNRKTYTQRLIVFADAIK